MILALATAPRFGAAQEISLEASRADPTSQTVSISHGTLTDSLATAVAPLPPNPESSEVTDGHAEPVSHAAQPAANTVTTAPPPGNLRPDPDRPVVDTLANGLTTILVPCEGPADFVSIYIGVAPPPVLPGSIGHGRFEVLVRSLFADADSTRSFSWIALRGGSAEARVGHHRSYFQFDVPAADVDSLFTLFSSRWTSGFSDARFTAGRDAAEANRRGHDRDAIEHLWKFFKASSNDWLWSDIEAGDIRAIFPTYLGARRMVLIAAGRPALLRHVSRALSILNGIPPGRYADAHDTRFSRTLKGTLTWPDHTWKEVTGVVLTIDRAWSAEEVRACAGALSLRVTNDLTRNRDLTYAVRPQFFIGDTECLVLFEPHYNDKTIDLADIEARIRKVAFELSRPSAYGWWQEYLDRRRQTDRLYGAASGNPARVAFDLGEHVVFPDSTAAQLDVPPPLTVDTVMARYQTLIENAQWFAVEPHQTALSVAVGAYFSQGVVTIWRDLLGPSNGNRALALICIGTLYLLVMRRLDRRPRHGVAARTRRA